MNLVFSFCLLKKPPRPLELAQLTLALLSPFLSLLLFAFLSPLLLALLPYLLLALLLLLFLNDFARCDLLRLALSNGDGGRVRRLGLLGRRRVLDTQDKRQ